MTTPNEPNKARTIPLHIADQAVAACEAEIQKLKEENARLKGEDYAYNELGSLVPRHLLEHWMDESARLKAEVERLTNENGNNFVMKEEWYLKCMSARAEVERLRKAGDAVSLCLEAYLYCKPYEGPMTIQCLDAWNAAKEGKPSV